MWVFLLDRMLRHIVRKGTLDLTLADGMKTRYGQGAPEHGLVLKSPDLPRKIILNPTLAVGEGYMDGTVEIENDDLRGFFQLMVPNFNDAGAAWFQKPLSGFRYSLRRLRQFAPVGTAEANVSHHYDLSHDLYDLFLDRDRQYSCAYWAEGVETLEQAQIAKKRHIAAKLMIEPGMRVLDIGCGWGHMACHIAKTYDVHVTGVALSQVQITACKARAKEMQVEDRVTFRYQDYRDVHERFDRVYSVGMLEHVGQPQYRTYFRKIAENLADDGVALVHFIGRTLPPGTLSPWFNKYIFPGGYSPALSEVTPQVEHAGLIPADIEIWRGHYDRTLFDWYERFEARADEAEAMYDATFVRMWRFYLVASVMAFREGLSFLTQMQLTKDPFLVPRTRGYLYQDQPETA